MRLAFIDGLRGLFAMLVVLSHFSAFFFEVFPLGFRNSSGSVCGFFVITGFILTYKFWLNGTIEPLTSSALRRYIRLTTMPLVSVLIGYFLFKYHLVFLHEACSLTQSAEFMKYYYNFAPHFKDALFEGVIGIYLPFDQMTSFNPVLWTMEYELKGSMFLLAFLALFGKVKNRLPLYIIFIVITAKTLYLTFVFGIMLGDMMYSAEGKKYYELLKRKKILSWSAFILGIICYSYGAGSDWIIHSKMNFDFLTQFNVNKEPFYHTLGATLIIYSVIQLELLQKILSLKFFTVLGKYSFSIYVVHCLALISAGGFIFLTAYNHNFSLMTSTLLGIAAALSAMALALKPLHNFVNIPTDRLAKRVSKIFE